MHHKNQSLANTMTSLESCLGASFLLRFLVIVNQQCLCKKLRTEMSFQFFSQSSFRLEIYSPLLTRLLFQLKSSSYFTLVRMFANRFPQYDNNNPPKMLTDTYIIAKPNFPSSTK